MTRARGGGQDGRAKEAPMFGLSLAICLPRDSLSVPVIRHLVRHALDEIGVLDSISSDIEIALGEACANVLRHAGLGDTYDVSVAIGPERCELRVVDVGHGFDHATIQDSLDTQDLAAERGRGLRLMRALVDHIELVSAPEEGTLVHLVKQLDFHDHSPARRLFLPATGLIDGSAPVPGPAAPV